MKPSKFDYYKPSTIEETLNLLATHGDEGKILAGGQSFIPILNMRMSEIESLIDINGVKNLDFIDVENDILRIGAMTRQSSIERSELIKDHLPLLREAITFIGHRQTRNRGTVGGSVAHADPSAELPLALLALNADVIIQSEMEERRANLEDFFLTYLTTDMMPDELLTRIEIPIDDVPNGYAFEEISRRHGDFALVSAACLMECDDAGAVTRIRLVIGGVDAVPLLASEDDIKPLLGTRLDDSKVDAAIENILLMAEPDADLHASSEYRFHLAGILAKRVMTPIFR